MPCARIIAPILAGLTLAGCECSGFLSLGSRSSCDAAILGGAVLTAPILLPAVLIDEATTGSASRPPAPARLSPVKSPVGEAVAGQTD